MENGPGLKMYFLWNMGDIPASYLTLPEGILNSGVPTPFVGDVQLHKVKNQMLNQILFYYDFSPDSDSYRGSYFQ